MHHIPAPPIESEILTREELTSLTGRSYREKQSEWLRLHGWRFETNAAGDPIVGRYYARMRLAGINLAPTLQPVQLDFSKAL